GRRQAEPLYLLDERVSVAHHDSGVICSHRCNRRRQAGWSDLGVGSPLPEEQGLARLLLCLPTTRRISKQGPEIPRGPSRGLVLDRPREQRERSELAAMVCQTAPKILPVDRVTESKIGPRPQQHEGFAGLLSRQHGDQVSR